MSTLLNPPPSVDVPATVNQHTPTTTEPALVCHNDEPSPPEHKATPTTHQQRPTHPTPTPPQTGNPTSLSPKQPQPSLTPPAQNQRLGDFSIRLNTTGRSFSDNIFVAEEIYTPTIPRHEMKTPERISLSKSLVFVLRHSTAHGGKFEGLKFSSGVGSPRNNCWRSARAVYKEAVNTDCR